MLQLTGRTQSPHGGSSLLSASTLMSSSTSMPLLLSCNGQRWRIDNGSIVNNQRQWRDFVLQSIALAAAGIVVVSPSSIRHRRWQTATRRPQRHLRLQSTNWPDCQGSPTKFTSMSNSVVRGGRRAVSSSAFWGTSCQGWWGIFLHFAPTAVAAMPGSFLH
jgi:hypothetical protein